ncbi:hypothetical protein Kisp02_42170 [Kineosporia sp. NBRC 101731]|nr:hypothetical protein Kisp02_42170 [Kineosporia sp. NBRC 101731]
MLERWSVVDCPFWVVEQPQYFVPVSARPTPGQVGAAMWALIGRTATADDLSIIPATATEAIETYLTSDDGDFAPGGLQITAPDVVIDPGCCFGLDEWRTWLEVLHGDNIYLGHDPDVSLEHRGSTVRLWKTKDEIRPGEAPGDHHTDIPRDALARLLRDVQQDLIGFLTALRPWAQAIVPHLAEPLTLAVDQRLRISAPLELEAEQHPSQI